MPGLWQWDPRAICVKTLPVIVKLPLKELWLHSLPEHDLLVEETLFSPDKPSHRSLHSPRKLLMLPDAFARVLAGHIGRSYWSHSQSEDDGATLKGLGQHVPYLS